ncbi:MAG: amino acid adenylation domain-containing protein [Prevotella sp.]|nr:amino acid adenylation domain-containing protein [Prevotella sp.]
MKTATLSKIQYGIYAECVAHKGETCYNIPYMFVLDGSLDEEKLKKAIETAVAAHPTLFTRIALNEQGDPIQTLDSSETFSLSVEPYDASISQSLVVPFDIVNDRLFHIRLLKDAEHFYLLLDIHHIIGDAITLKVMLADIEAAYYGKALEPETMTMMDVAIADAEKRQTPAFEEGKQWYAQNFDCGDTSTLLIPDLEGTERTEANAIRMLSVDKEKIETFCKSNGIYKNTLFLSAYAYLLAKFNNEQEALFTTVYNGRNDQRLAHTVGMTVKILPVYAKFTNDTSVMDFMKACQEQNTGCREHDVYTYPDLMADLNLQSNSMFAWRGSLFVDTQLMGKPMQTIQLCNHTLEVPLCMMVYTIGSQYQLRAEYDASAYSEALISEFMESYEAALNGFLSETTLCDIDITTTSQVATLDNFNQTDEPYDDMQTIVSLFRQQVKATPENIAVVYKDKKYTYADVDSISDRIAGYIWSKVKGQRSKDDVQRKEVVVSILIPRCEWMAIASMGVLKAGCAYQPLDPSYPKERLNFMMQDANAQLLIADEELRPIVDEYQGEVLLTRDIDKLPNNPNNPNTPISPNNLFILLYTSGSTGVPKGCQLEHRNLVAFCHWYQRYYSLKPEHNVAAYASYGFDACMMDMYPALTCGATVYIIPEELRLDLIALNDYFEQNKITHSFMTTQVGYQFATSIENHSLLHLSTGGEKLASMTPPTNYHFYNAYGPTECTIYTTAYLVDKKLKEIPIGKPLDNMHLYIVDPQGHRLPVGAAGELWISGPQVSRGYLNRPEKTAEVYIQNPFTDNDKYARVYRSGDIVRYLPSGDIQFVGRRDGQVKIRGFRIELKEVEAVIREFPGIKDATVQAFDEEGGGKFIAAYIVSDEQVDIEALNSFILDQKPPYMVPAVTMQIEAIPLNQNQKVNKKALPKPEKKAAIDEVETNVPMNVLEKEIHDIIAQIINNEEFGITTILGYAGLTSIMAIKLAIQINKRFGITLDSKALAKTGSVQSIENEILTMLMSGNATTQQAGATEHADMSNIPLSYAQMGVYVDSIKTPESTIYNTPLYARFPKNVDIKQLVNAVETLIKMHPMLQAHFGSAGADIIQIVDPNQPIEITQSQRKESDMPQYRYEFIIPFNLRQGPLYHIEIVTTEEWVYLMMDIHHLVIDGGSFDVLLSQLFDLLNGKEIEPESFTYADFVAAQKAAESSEEYAAARDFFQARLGNIEGVTEVPTDLTNPVDQGKVGTVYCPLDFEAIDAFCRQHNISPAHHILAATFYALSRFTNNEQLCITTISNGRSDLRISNTVGMFVNTLALSAEIGDQTVLEFLNETSKNFDETLQHEAYPFARIAADYDLSAEILFAYQMGIIADFKYKGQTVTIDTFETDTPKFRIAFFIMNDPLGKPSVCLQYDNGRYSQETMQCLAQSICNATNAFMRQPEAAIQSISLLDVQQTSLLDSFNDTEVPYDDTQTVVSLFRRQVQLTPDNMAVVYHDNKYTYREVDDLSERIATLLVGKGLGKEDVVSIIIPRCEWMPIAALGVLKAGCAYQPLDPSYPQERLNFMIKDAAAKLLIADESLRDMVSEYNGEVLLTKDIKQLPVASKPVDVTPNPADLYILLYTSGSTGLPKGCQLEHHNLAAFCHWYQRRFELKAEHHVSCYASYGFDCCMMDLYPALTCGACVYIIGDDIRLTLPEVNAYFEENHITHSFMTTQVAYQFATNYDNHSLLHLIAAGEKLASLAPPKNFKMHNGYGPTEGTILITEYEVDKELKDIPVGKPLDNSRLYIVDKQFNRLPQGALGELWISGPHVTRSYLNRPEKTAEVYINNPFSDDPKFSRIYRTGDIVRYQPDGNIQFVGRKDGQVKIRGFRIELKEIEAVIRQYPGIKDVTVQAFDYDNGGKFVAAYIVSDEQVDIKELNAFIGKQKPSYMIPVATMQIDSIPLNQNQKVNRKALPTPVIQAADHEYVEPAGDVEKLFCKIFSDILSMDKIGATDNFFELGGTSLMVTRVIIEADKNGHHIAYGDVFANPTPRQLSNFISGGANDEDEEARNYNYGAINTLLEENTLDAFLGGERQPIGNVLLTGATGFLGIHILQELIERDDVPVIWCLVRGEDDEKAERRLKSLMFYYFNKNYNQLFGNRLRIINGDVTQDIKVDGKIDTVFNCAAVVKHFSKGTEIEDVNVGGALNCVKFCLLNNARLIHVSTYSTAGMSVDGIPAEDSIYTEQKLYFGQNLGNQYIHSKFISERIVLDAVALHKLNAKIMRVGNLAPRSTDGEFQINFNTNSAMGRIRVYQMLGCYPYAINDEPMEFTPINEVAKAIVLLSETPQECCVFHPFNNHFVHFGDVLQELSLVTQGPRQVEADEFNNELEAAKQDPEKAKRLSSLLAYQDMAHGQKVIEIPSENQYTTQVLYRLGFRWSPTSWNYVDQMLTAIAGFGFFE